MSFNLPHNTARTARNNKIKSKTPLRSIRGRKKLLGNNLSELWRHLKNGWSRRLGFAATLATVSSSSNWCGCFKREIVIIVKHLRTIRFCNDALYFKLLKYGRKQYVRLDTAFRRATSLPLPSVRFSYQQSTINHKTCLFSNAIRIIAKIIFCFFPG